MIALAIWLLALPLRLLVWLGLRGSVILACLLVLAVTAYGVAQDLSLLDRPAATKPAPRAPAPSRAATADIPAGCMRRCTPTTTPGPMSPGSSGSPAAMSPVGVGGRERDAAAI